MAKRFFSSHFEAWRSFFGFKKKTLGVGKNWKKKHGRLLKNQQWRVLVLQGYVCMFCHIPWSGFLWCCSCFFQLFLQKKQTKPLITVKSDYLEHDVCQNSSQTFHTEFPTSTAGGLQRPNPTISGRQNPSHLYGAEVVLCPVQFLSQGECIPFQNQAACPTKGHQGIPGNLW